MAFAGTTRFSLLAKLGEGGMGIVYEAYDHSREMRVALKTLRHVGPVHLYHFKREFRALSHLSHPNIITLYELLSEGGHWFLTMELVEGPDFIAHVRKSAAGMPWQLGTAMDLDDLATMTSPSMSKPASPAMFSPADIVFSPAFDHTVGPAFAEPLPGQLTPVPSQRTPIADIVDLGRLRDILAQLAQALHALHSAGMVHRDLKPSNVRVAADGRVILMDFGIVAERGQRTAPELAGSTMGTPSYMAPEQVEGAPATAAADWYAFGVMLYHALAGKLPHEGTAEEIMRAKKERDPLPPSAFVMEVPDDLEALCMQLLARAPEARPSGAAVLARLGVSSRAIADGTSPGHADMPLGDFVGRAAELRALRDAYATAAQQGTACVVVQGPSGMGKTRLLERFLGQLSAMDSAVEPVVLSGRCHERETVPYKAFDGVIDSLSHHLSSLPASERATLMPPETAALTRLFPVLLQVVSREALGSLEGWNPMEARAQAIESLRALFIALGKERPMVVCIEDIQWADRDSFDVLRALLRPPAPSGLLVLATLRSEALEAGTGTAVSSALHEFMAELDQRDFCRFMSLGPLSDREQRELLNKLGQRRGLEVTIDDQLWQESAGHPMLLVELIRFLQDTSATLSPAASLHLEDVIWGRVNRLPVPARMLMEVIAVAGEPLPLGVLAAAAGLSSADRERAAATVCVAHLARVCKAEHEPWLDRFHDKVREAIMERLPGERVRFLHVQLAHALESWADAPVTTMAHQWLAAGDPQQAALYLLEAGRSAAHQLAFARAADLYRAGLELIPESYNNRRLELARCRAWIGLAEGMRMADRDDEALALLDKAESVATEFRMSEELAALHYLRGTLLFPRGDVQGCLGEHEKAYAFAIKARSAESEALALSGLGDAYYLCARMLEAHTYFGRCIEVCQTHGFSGIKAANLYMRGLTHYFQNDYESALRDGLDAAALAAQIGHLRAEVVARSCCLGWALTDMGRLEQARREYERSLGILRTMGARRFEPFALSGLARVLALESRLDEAADLARQSVAVCRDNEVRFLGPMALGVLALVTTDRDEQARALAEAESMLKGNTVGHNHLHFYRDAIEIALQDRDADRAERYASLLERYTEPEPLPWSRLVIDRARALASQLRGQGRAHEDSLRRLHDEARRVGAHVAARALDQALQASDVSDSRPVSQPDDLG